jgi:WASH complex subunit 7
LRETKTFRENKEAWDGKYPYTRADSLMKEIKRLGVFEDGKTFLDKFRLLITTIGNSLG